jgi:tubby-related protein 1
MDPAEQLQANMARMRAAAQRKSRPMAGMVMSTDSDARRPTTATSTASAKSSTSMLSLNSAATATTATTVVRGPLSGDEDETSGQERIRRQLENIGISSAVDSVVHCAAGPVEHRAEAAARVDVADPRTFLAQTPPKVGMIQCYIEREKHPLYGYKYNLFLEDGDVFLVCSVKRKHNKTSNYLISIDRDDLSRESGHFYGKLRSNFVGTEFTAYDKGEKPTKEGEARGLAQRHEIAAVIYERNILGTKGPRKMCVIIPSVDENGKRASWRPEKEEDGLIGKFKRGQFQDMMLLKNKDPSWNEQLRAYVLNFSGRVTMASVKNFQLVDQEHPHKVLMQFGKVDGDKFTLDFQYPVSGLQAFAIALSAFDGKLACE